MNPLGLLFFLLGGFVVSAAALDWDFFMTSYRARTIVGIFGRTGARIFYGFLGLFLITMGVLFTAGLLS